VHLLEAGEGIEYVANHLGYRNIRNTSVNAQITNPLRDQVLRELAQHPKIVKVECIDTYTYAPLSHTKLARNRQLRQ